VRNQSCGCPKLHARLFFDVPSEDQCAVLDILLSITTNRFSQPDRCSMPPSHMYNRIHDMISRSILRCSKLKVYWILTRFYLAVTLWRKRTSVSDRRAGRRILDAMIGKGTFASRMSSEAKGAQQQFVHCNWSVSAHDRAVMERCSPTCHSLTCQGEKQTCKLSSFCSSLTEDKVTFSRQYPHVINTRLSPSHFQKFSTVKQALHPLTSSCQRQKMFLT
jgi:hypothetical protein